MANTTLTADVVAKEALYILDNEVGVVGKLHRAHEEEYTNRVNGYKIGDTLSIRRPADFTVRTGATMNLQDVIEGKTTITIDQQLGVDFSFTSSDLTLSVEDLSERVIRPAMTNIINTMADDVLTQMYQGTYNWVGTAGQTVNSFTDFVKGPERLDEMSVPVDGRCSVLSPSDYWGVVGNQTSLFSRNIVDPAYRKGYLGEIGGIETYMSQVTPTHTRGTGAGTPLVDGASQNVTYDTAKNTWTQTLITDGWTGSTTLKAGDVFTIANVNMVNPKTKVSTGILQQFVITADVTANANSANDTNLVVSPPIITSGPHQTVDAAPANDAAITVQGAVSTAYKQNMVFHKSSMALAVVPMEIPQGSVNASRKSYKGYSVRVVPVYDGVNDVSKWRLDLLYGRKMIDPRMITRMSGTA